MGLRDIGATLPPGFRFYPSDEELVCHYLFKKIANEDVLKGTLVEIDLHTCEPWQLPGISFLFSLFLTPFSSSLYAMNDQTYFILSKIIWSIFNKTYSISYLYVHHFETIYFELSFLNKNFDDALFFHLWDI